MERYSCASKAIEAEGMRGFVYSKAFHPRDCNILPSAEQAHPISEMNAQIAHKDISESCGEDDDNGGYINQLNFMKFNVLLVERRGMKIE